MERAGEGVDRLARLISRLSEATRLERMLESAERERFDLAAVVAGCVEGYRSAYAPRKFELQMSVRPELVEGRGSTGSPRTEVWGVPDAIAQMLDKLAENANDFAPPDTPIVVSLEARGSGARLAVQNEGPPLPAPARARLFDSMVSLRGPDARTDGAHLGLGLYIVRIVAEFHGGTVRAEDLPGGAGVRFVVELP